MFNTHARMRPYCINGVDQQIDQNLTDLNRAAGHQGVCCHLIVNLDGAFVQARLDQHNCFADAGRQVDLIKVVIGFAGKTHQRFRQITETIGLRNNALQVLHHGFCATTLNELQGIVGVCAHCGQRLVVFMT